MTGVTALNPPPRNQVPRRFKQEGCFRVGIRDPAPPDRNHVRPYIIIVFIDAFEVPPGPSEELYDTKTHRVLSSNSHGSWT
jgi:hypothetical protein